ncbi:MAG: DUF305 domain-containing protein [Bacteroidota bacterium]|nr:DUF305 domain-containing protein [Bacteroidota bacterium]
MKSTLLFSATLATALLSACGDNKTTTETTTASTSAAMPDSAKMDGKMDGMAAADAASSAATGSLTGAMAKMMQKANAGKPIGNTDHDFAHMMITHHEGAIDMSEIELRDGKDATLRAMAEKIIADQKKEVADLDKAAERLDGSAKNYTPKDPNDQFQMKMDQSMKPMMAPMTPSGNVDMDYARMMVAHHTSTVQMAEAEVAMGKDAETKKMAQMQISAQTKEIQQFNDWLAKNGGKMKM